jgi:PilZ domain
MRDSGRIISPNNDDVPVQRRHCYRKPVRLAGEISLGDKSSRFSCDIIDMSASGARLSVSREHSVSRSGTDCLTSRRIALFLDRKGTSVECQVVWRGGDEFGVRFCSPIQYRAA